MNEKLKVELRKNVGMRLDLDRMLIVSKACAERYDFKGAIDQLQGSAVRIDDLIASYKAIEESSDA